MPPVRGHPSRPGERAGPLRDLRAGHGRAPTTTPGSRRSSWSGSARPLRGLGRADRHPALRPDPGGRFTFRSWWARLLRSGTSPQGAEPCCRCTAELDTRHVLPSISVPTLVMHRDGDLVVTPRPGRYLAEHIPGARYVELDGDDHLRGRGRPGRDPRRGRGVPHRRAARCRDPDRILATVMFTDIVSSTERAAELGDSRWRELLESHDALVRRQLDRHRGREVKTLGDGFLATFDGPARAIRCARRSATRCGGSGWRSAPGCTPASARRSGRTWAAWPCTSGRGCARRPNPGEVLVSSTVKDLVVGSGIEFATAARTS